MPKSECPNHDELRAFLIGSLPGEKAEALVHHLDDCPACEQTLQGLSDGEDTLVAQLRIPSSGGGVSQEPQCREALERAKAALRGEPPPRRLGEYELWEEIGRGGMGIVYKARHSKLGRPVILKTLSPERLGDAQALARFYREMRAVGRLDHANIVRPIYAGEADGIPYLVMEYAEGRDLAEVLARCGRVAVPDACEIVREAACGLQYIHEHGLVHRDIKPSNLLLTSPPSPSRRAAGGKLPSPSGRGAGGAGGEGAFLPSPSGTAAGGEGALLPSPSGRGAGGEGGAGYGAATVKILDLGLARFEAEPSAREITAAGHAMGTADYMAPEQVSDAHSVDIRADIYSLGCTLYKLLTGRAPFSGPQYKTRAETMVGHLKETPPPVRQLRSDVPAELAAVIERMMAKSPDDRFTTPSEVAAAMTSFAAGCNLARVAVEAATKSAVATGLSVTATGPLASAVVDAGAGGSAESFQPPAPPRFGKPLRLWIALGFASLFAVVLLGILIMLQTREGTLIVEMDDAGAIVQVLNEKSEVVIEHKGEKGSVTIGVAPGKGRLRLVKDGMELFARDFSLVSGGKETIRARLERDSSIADIDPQISDRKSELPPAAVAPFDAKKAKEHQAAWAKHLGVPVQLTNSIGMKLVLIPPGEFLMGSPKELIDEQLKTVDVWYRSYFLAGEMPQHRVRITKPFYLGMYVVTQEEYQRVMGYNPSEFCATGNGKDKVEGQDTRRFPVENVSWNLAAEFCRKLSAMPEEKEAARTYRLPAEAQWEYACRAGSTGRFSFSSGRSGITKQSEEHELLDYGWCSENAGGRTHAVGEKRASAWGLYDMHGNVWEMCQDWYDFDYYALSPVDDPTGPVAGSTRVDRGGSVCHLADTSRSACRAAHEPRFRILDIGFRVSLLVPHTAAERAKMGRTTPKAGKGDFIQGVLSANKYGAP